MTIFRASIATWRRGALYLLSIIYPNLSLTYFFPFFDLPYLSTINLNEILMLHFWCQQFYRDHKKQES